MEKDAHPKIDKRGHAVPSARVLVAVEEKGDLLVAKAVLKEMHLDAVVVTSLQDVIRHLKSPDIALTILDADMHGIDGAEISQVIRHGTGPSITPVIFLTKEQSGENRLYESYEPGSVDSLVKPVVPELLRSKITLFLELIEKRHQVRRMKDTLGSRDPEATIGARHVEVQIRHIFEFALDGIYQVDATGRRFTIVNPAMAEILGFPSPQHLIEEVGDIQSDMYVDPEDYDVIQEALKRSGVVSSFEARVRRADGQIIWVSQSARTLVGEGGSIIGFEGMLRNVTQQKRAEEQIAAKNKDLQTLLYVTSHDLKEPLRGILGYTREIVESEVPNLPESMRESLSHIIEEAERLDGLIDSVRTLIQVQQISSEMKRVDAEGLVQQGVAILQRRIEETSAQITIEPGLPVLIANERWVIHAITNLLSNAIKFTRPGEKPQIIVTSCPQDKCGAGRGLIIRDRGIGVPEEHRKRIFELFKRAGNHQVEGTGAGLAIVAQIAKGHGGSAWVEPREGGGSDFYLVLGAAEITSSSGSNVCP